MLMLMHMTLTVTEPVCKARPSCSYCQCACNKEMPDDCGALIWPGGKALTQLLLLVLSSLTQA